MLGNIRFDSDMNLKMFFFSEDFQNSYSDFTLLLQFSLFFQKKIQRNDLMFCHQSDQKNKWNMLLNVSCFHGINHLDNHLCFQTVQVAFHRLVKLTLGALQVFRFSGVHMKTLKYLLCDSGSC